MSAPFMAGSLVTSTATFLDGNGNPADPSAVTLKYKQGAGATTTVTYQPNTPTSITRNSPGVYSTELDTTGWTGPDNQLWTVQWSGAGNVQAIAVSNWQVEPAAL